MNRNLLRPVLDSDLRPFASLRAATFTAAVFLSFCTSAFAQGEGPDMHTYTRGARGTDRVALSFDDGPHPRLTPKLLDILSERGVTATFFVLGDQVRRFPEIARATAERGHEIANHGYTHENLRNLRSDAIASELTRTQSQIEEATSFKATLFRPPYGATKREVFERAGDHGLTVVTWSVDPRDWERGKTTDQIVDFVVSRASGGSIILLHDIHSRSVDAVPRIIDGLRAKGLQFATVGQLVAERKEERAREAAEPGAVSIPADPSAPLVVPLSSSTYKRRGKNTKNQH